MASTNLQILVDQAIYKQPTAPAKDNGKILFVSPAYSLYSGNTDTPVVTAIAGIYTYQDDGADKTAYVQSFFTFELQGPLLDSAPTQAARQGSGSENNLFVVFVSVGQSSDVFIVDAQIQTKGNSALSPTYKSKPTQIFGTSEQPTGDYYISFPVTTFFNVSQPGSPYTLTITLSRVKEQIPK